MQGSYDGWHRMGGQLVYVKNGLVIKKCDIKDGEMKTEKIDKPCTLNTYKARLWHKKRKEKEYTGE